MAGLPPWQAGHWFIPDSRWRLAARNLFLRLMGMPGVSRMLFRQLI